MYPILSRLLVSNKKLCIFLVLLNFLMYVALADNILCYEKGKCKECKKEDMFNDYCKETGRTISMICNDGELQYEELRSCPLSAEDEQIRVIVFQVVMGILGGIAYWAAQKRKVTTMSLFDSRKYRFR